MGYPLPVGLERGTPLLLEVRAAQRLLATRRAVYLLRSRRRTFLLKFKIGSMQSHGSVHMECYADQKCR